ncbi:MAG TPA: hypothetical protein VK002_13070 [Rubricoccaceae bacterium]|nr:hypothetical protein [Rubricoccaceae bacterium]
MSSIFQARLNAIYAAFERLNACPPMQRGALTLSRYEKVPGVYVFSEDEQPLYVGRSRNLRHRILSHARPGVRDSSFALRLAREVTGAKPTYSREGSRTDLFARNPDFVRAYREQKARIAQMSIQYVIEEDPVNQALLEIYASDVLKTPYNDFNTT